MMRFFAPLIFLTAAGCYGDETVSGYATAEATYVLKELNGEPFNARATITFPEQGKVAGEGPCNSWIAEQSAPYPWIRLGPVTTTRMSCPDLHTETGFFAALSAVTLAEFSGPALLLSDDTGPKLVFMSE